MAKKFPQRYMYFLLNNFMWLQSSLSIINNLVFVTLFWTIVREKSAALFCDIVTIILKIF